MMSTVQMLAEVLQTKPYKDFCVIQDIIYKKREDKRLLSKVESKRLLS